MERKCNMRGKKTAPETVYAIMALWAINQNPAETARVLELPETTVRDIVDRNKNEEKFVELRKQKEADFSANATRIINKGTRLLERRLTRALDQEDELDLLIDHIDDLDDKEMPYKKKQALINKIQGLQLQKISELSTMLGTMYDKRALADGSSTGNIKVEICMPDGADEYAG